MQQSFFFQALIYLGSAVLLVPFSKKLGLGSVLGYLLAGILIGPSVLAWIGNDGADIMHFAEFGVVMMLFLIGLEVEPQLLWRWRSSIMGLGGLQVLVTTLIVGFIAHIIIGLPFNQALAIGLIFAMSSTAIVLQTMTENNWMQTHAGRNAFSVLLFQDIAVIPILAILPLLTPDGVPHAAANHATITENLEPWAKTLAVLGAVAAIIFGGRYLTRPIFKIVAGTNLRELFTATALLLVVGITVLMTLVGLSPALGAFLAGVVLANSEYRHELESDIEPFKGLLLGLFFMAVGASIDFQLIAAKPLLIAGIVLGVMLIKLGILAVLSRLFKMRVDQFLLFAFALAQVGEFGFVLFSFARDQNIFDAELFNLLMVVVAATMALSPIFMLIMEKILMPRVVKKLPEPTASREADVIDESNQVIIAGYGRFGSVTGRFLKANGINTTVLDANSDRVESLRKIGIKVYYGDALRIDLLKAAGAEKAKLIVIALDDSAQVLQLVNIVKKHYPNLHIIARAHGLDDTYELMDAGVLHVFRETIDTSLRAGTEALKIMGVRAYTAQRAHDLFMQHDEKSLKKMAAARFDKKRYIRAMRNRIEELETLIQNDIHERSIHTHTGKDMSEVRKEDEDEEDV